MRDIAWTPKPTLMRHLNHGLVQLAVEWSVLPRLGRFLGVAGSRSSVFVVVGLLHAEVVWVVEGVSGGA